MKQHAPLNWNGRTRAKVSQRGRAGAWRGRTASRSAIIDGYRVAVASAARMASSPTGWPFSFEYGPYGVPHTGVPVACVDGVRHLHFRDLTRQVISGTFAPTVSRAIARKISSIAMSAHRCSSAVVLFCNGWDT